MHPLCVLIIYLVLVFVGGALLAPWAFELARWGGGHYSWLQSLAEHPFHRFVHRSLLVLALLGLSPFLRALGIKSWGEAGMSKPFANWNKLAAGFVLGFGSLALVVGIVVASGARTLELNHAPQVYAQHLVRAGLTALVVGIMEELLFRGVLFGSLRKSIRWQVALGLSSALYALLHFFQRPEPPGTIDWASGLAMLPQMMRGFTEWQMLIPGFFTLTLVGVLLGLGYQRTGTLHLSIGMHAGWIFWLKFYGFLTRPTSEATNWFYGSSKLTDGWLAFLVVGMAGCVMWRWMLPDKKQEGRIAPA